MPDASAERLLSQLDDRATEFAGSRARDALRGALAGPLAPPGWVPIKQNVSRTVYRGVSADGEALYLKCFHSRTPWHRLQRRLGLSDAAREMRFSRFLSSHDIPVPEILAIHASPRDEWLVSRAVEPGRPADQWHMERIAAGNAAAIRSATAELGCLIGRMHAHGVLHGDLHCGNIMVRLSGDSLQGPGMRTAPDPGKLSPDNLVLMDLHRMRRRRRLSRRRRAINLAQLLHDRRPWTTRTDRLRFLKHYLAASNAEGTLRGWVRLIEPLARRYSRRLFAQRERRIVGDNRYFATVRAGGYRGHAVLASKRDVPGSRATGMVFTREQWRQVLADPEVLLAGEGAEVVKDSPSSLVVRRKLAIGDAEIDVFVKRSRRKRPTRWLADLFRRSRAVRSFRLGHALLARHIHTALPLAAVEKRRAGFLVDSILITEAVPDSMHLHKFLARYLAPAETGETPAPRQSYRLAQTTLWQLGRLLRRLHEEGFAHRDLKASNLLVHWREDPERAPEIVLVDLDGVHRHRRVSIRREFRGLMRLNVSLLECPAVNRAGRLRMLLGYLRGPGVGRINFRPYWRLLQDWSSRKIRRQIASRQLRQKAQRRARP